MKANGWIAEYSPVQLTGLIKADCDASQAHKIMFSVQQHLIIDNILLYFINFIQPRDHITFKQFADHAYISGTTTLAFGEKGSEERRRSQFRLRDLKKQLTNSNPYNPNSRLTLPSNFCLQVCDCWLLAWFHSVQFISCCCIAGLHHHVLRRLHIFFCILQGAFQIST